MSILYYVTWRNNQEIYADTHIIIDEVAYFLKADAEEHRMRITLDAQRRGWIDFKLGNDIAKWESEYGDMYPEDRLTYIEERNTWYEENEPVHIELDDTADYWEVRELTVI
jgi:hypothetical protein